MGDGRRAGATGHILSLPLPVAHVTGHATSIKNVVCCLHIALDYQILYWFFFSTVDFLNYV
jgi:hypothetical protein